MTGPLQEQRWREELKDKAQHFEATLRKRTKELDEQLQRTEERTKEMLRITNRRIIEQFHKKTEAALTQLRQQEQERLLYWQRRCEDVKTIYLLELATRLTHQLLGKEGAPHD